MKKWTNWSFSLLGFLQIIICEKIFTWGSVKDESIYYKTLSLIKDSQSQCEEKWWHLWSYKQQHYHFFITFLFSVFVDIFVFVLILYILIFIEDIPITTVSHGFYATTIPTVLYCLYKWQPCLCSPPSLLIHILACCRFLFFSLQFYLISWSLLLLLFWP